MYHCADSDNRAFSINPNSFCNIYNFTFITLCKKNKKMKYTIGVASGSYEWESESEDLTEVASEFLENADKDLALGLIVAILKEGEGEEETLYINTATLLANIGDYEAAEKLKLIAKNLTQEFRNEEK